MKKFIVLLISLFLGLFLSTNIQVDTIKKNDITTLAICTDNNVDIVSTNVISTDYSFINTGSDIHYYLNGIMANNISNNHSTIVNSVKLYTDYLISAVNITLSFLSYVDYLPITKTDGLLGVMNKVHFNIYLYHFINKLGQT